MTLGPHCITDKKAELSIKDLLLRRQEEDLRILHVLKADLHKATQNLELLTIEHETSKAEYQAIVKKIKEMESEINSLRNLQRDNTHLRSDLAIRGQTIKELSATAGDLNRHREAHNKLDTIREIRDDLNLKAREMSHKPSRSRCVLRHRIGNQLLNTTALNEKTLLLNPKREDLHQPSRYIRKISDDYSFCI
jgi:uncharacterized coiled-coil DUF342 family protein